MRLETIKEQQEKIDHAINSSVEEIINNPLKDKFDYFRLYETVRVLFLMCHHRQALQWVIDGVKSDYRRGKNG